MGWGGGWGELFGVPNMFNQHLKSLLSQLFWWIWYFDVLVDAATQDLWQSSPDCRGQWIIQWVEILFQTYENIISLQNLPFSKHFLNLCTHEFLISYSFGPHFIATQSHLSGYHHWSAEAAPKFVYILLVDQKDAALVGQRLSKGSLVDPAALLQSSGGPRAPPTSNHLPRTTSEKFRKERHQQYFTHDTAPLIPPPTKKKVMTPISHLIHHEALGTGSCLAPSSLIMTWEGGWGRISITRMMRMIRMRMTTSMVEDQG